MNGVHDFGHPRPFTMSDHEIVHHARQRRAEEGDNGDQPVHNRDISTLRPFLDQTQRIDEQDRHAAHDQADEGGDEQEIPVVLETELDPQ